MSYQENVFPRDWSNPVPAGKYNLVVVGAGPAGLITAAGAAGLGAKVALVERHAMGGDCLNVGCVPSKALIAAARTAAHIRRAGEFGVRVPDGVRVDFPAVMQRLRGLREKISFVDAARRYRDDLGVAVFLGPGRFVGRDCLEVAGSRLTFSKAAITTGARAAIPDIPGLAESGALTNETIFSLTAMPQRLAVIGAGPIGCELAQAFARLGSAVTILNQGPGILPKDDRHAAAVVEASLERDGIRIHHGAKLQRVEHAQGSAHRIHFASAQGAESVIADCILVAAGRLPNVDDLGLEAAGVEFNRDGVRIDDRLRTSNPRIYAAGDVAMKFKFTHSADAAARILIQNALFAGRKKLSALTIPWCTYTDPELAHVGQTEDEARASGLDISVIRQPLHDVDRAVLDAEAEGFAKLVVERRSGKILGATIVAAHAGDLISEISLAMTHRLGLGAIASTIHPYPTQAEVLKKAADAHNRTRLTPLVKKLLGKWLHWTR